MENQKYPINNNPNNNHQAENSASTSSTNPAIKEQEKELKEKRFKDKYKEISINFLNNKISQEQYEKEIINLRNYYSLFSTQKEILEIENEADKELELIWNESDSEEESENCWYEELTEEEQEAAEQAWQENKLNEIEKTNSRILAIAAEQENNLKILEANEKALENREKRLELALKNKAVSLDNKEIIKAEISQELTTLKESFENIAVSRIIESEIKNKVKKSVEEISANSLTGLFRLPFGPSAALKNEMEWHFFNRIQKSVNKSVNNLAEQKNKAVRKMNALIAARDKEVIATHEAIAKMEDIIEKLKNDNNRQREEAEGKISKLQELSEQEIQTLKNLSEEEQSKLQEEISKLANQLKDWKEREERLKAERTKKLTKENLQKINADCKNPKPPMENPNEKIIRLEKELEEMRFSAIVFKESEEQRATELKDEKELRATSETNLRNQLEREKDFLNSKLEKETEFLNNQIARKEAEIEEIKTVWQNTYNRSEDRCKAAEERETKLRKEWEEENAKNDRLESENRILKADKDRRKEKIKELEEKLKALEPSWAYQMADKIGLVKLKNAGVNIILLFGLLAIIYAISLVLKYIAKPAWLNLAGFFPKSKKRKVITVAEEQEEEEGEEIFEVEPKPVKNFSRLNSPKKTAKTKGKSKSKTK